MCDGYATRCIFADDEAAASAATHDDKPKQRRGSLDVTWTTTSKDTLPPFSIKKDSSDSLQHDHPPEIVATAINKHLSTREDIALVDATPALMMPGYPGLAVALAGLSAEVLALLDARRREVTNAEEEALRINLDVSGAADQDGTHHQVAVGVGRVPFIFMVTSVQPIHTDF